MFHPKDKVGPVVGIVVILVAVGAGVWGVVKLISGKSDTPPVTQALDSDVGTFVQIAAGEFMMGGDGDNDEKPAHNVKITRSFEMGKHEVTQAQWEAVMGSNPSDVKGANLPVVEVSWNDAQEFIKKLNAKKDGYSYRLPTEAEWEYACRAGTTGDYTGNLDEMAWSSSNSANKTHPVGEKKANAWGLHDMHGNVWEWCSDWYDENYYKQSPRVDSSGPSTGSDRANRGGSWYFNARFLRSANRNWSKPDFRANSIGFRLVRTSP